MIRTKGLTRVCLFFVAAALFFFVPRHAPAQVQEIRIGDSKGDWGYPNPYRHTKGVEQKPAQIGKETPFMLRYRGMDGAARPSISQDERSFRSW